MSIRKYKGWWGLYDAEGCLICVCVYKKGAKEAERRFRLLCLLMLLSVRCFAGPDRSHGRAVADTGEITAVPPAA